MSQYQLSTLASEIKAIILDSLELEDKNYDLSTYLMDGLGAESLDFLDIVFRLERRFKVKIERGRLEKDLRQAFPNAEVRQNTEITPEMSTVLGRSLPEVPASRLAQVRRLKDVPGTFSIGTFVRLTVQALRDTDSTVSIVCDVDYPAVHLGIA